MNQVGKSSFWLPVSILEDTLREGSTLLARTLPQGDWSCMGREVRV
jgi:hypothetical protein